jgi:hypothetical protein
MAAAAAVGAAAGERSVPPQQSIFFHELNELMQHPIFAPFGPIHDIEQILLGLRPRDNFFPAAAAAAAAAAGDVAGAEIDENLEGEEASFIFLIFHISVNSQEEAGDVDYDDDIIVAPGSSVHLLPSFISF